MKFFFEFKEKLKKEHQLPEQPLVLTLLKIILLALIGTLFIFSAFRGFQPEKKYRPGDIAVRDFIIKKDLLVEDPAATSRLRNEELSKIPAIYDFDSGVPWEIENFLNLLINGRLKEAEKHFLFAGFSGEERQKLFLLLKKVQLQSLKELLSGLYQRGVYQGEIQRLGESSKKIALHKADEVQEADIIDLNSVEDVLKKVMPVIESARELSEAEKALFTEFLGKLIKPNIFYNADKTQKALQSALSRIRPQLIQLKAGYALLRKGDEVSADKYHLLQIILEKTAPEKSRILNFYLIFLLLFSLLLIMHSLLHSLQKKGLGDARVFQVFALTLLLSILLARFFLIIFSLLLRDVSAEIGLNYNQFQIYYLLPFAFGPLLVSFLYDFILGVLFSVFNAFILTILADFDFKVFLLFFASSVAINFGIEFYSRLKRSSLIRATIIFLLPVTVFMTVIFYFFEGQGTTLEILIYIVFIIGAALSAAILATFAVPIYEYLFRIVTDLKLIELTNLYLPVFRQMLEKAPGTYHHSQMVASLAEAAADQLKISPLWLRAMALYHDIGKIDQPQFFTENHTIYENPHPKLSPEQSAKMIIAHLNSGIELAEKLKLPQKIKNAILTHHGTKKVRYFYEKTRQTGEEIAENVFTYPGIKPQTVEDAVIMIADQVEAAVKSLSSPGEQEIMNVIEKVINANIEEKQFDECEGLSFKVLQLIASSFFYKLISIYHQRVAYPGFNFKER